jgi:hypothetical protein
METWAIEAAEGQESHRRLAPGSKIQAALFVSECQAMCFGE